MRIPRYKHIKHDNLCKYNIKKTFEVPIIYNITVLHSIILMVDQLTLDFYYEVQKLDLNNYIFVWCQPDLLG